MAALPDCFVPADDKLRVRHCEGEARGNPCSWFLVDCHVTPFLAMTTTCDIAFFIVMFYLFENSWLVSGAELFS
jgi:hypothetical protein